MCIKVARARERRGPAQTAVLLLLLPPPLLLLLLLLRVSIAVNGN
jgi:hypothetical protein